ncbi:MAG: hypothetical protein IPM81_18510 [Saprospirales bacterium]|nr:hypothetical protein [Saprospirales bacterium]
MKRSKSDYSCFQKYALLLLLVSMQGGLSAQIPVGEPPCLFDVLHPAGTLQAAESRIGAAVGKQNPNGVTENNDDIRIVPVVVHVIHNGGSENISKAQIERQIEILNEDYGKLPGSPGDGAGVDTRVRFCLAKTDPQGRCTDGIVRLKTTLTNHQPVDRGHLEKPLVLGQHPLPEYVCGQKH